MGKFLDFVKSFFGSVWHFLADYLHAAIPEATAVVMKDLLPIADTVVQDLSSTTMTGAQKKDAAVTAIQGKLASIGIDVGISLINLAIEMAVQKFKNTPSVVAGNEGNVNAG